MLRVTPLIVPLALLILAAACGNSDDLTTTATIPSEQNPTATPSPTLTHTPPTPSALERVLAMTPASFADQPLEFADYRGSLVSQGFKGYSTLDDEVLLDLILEMAIEESRQGRTPWKGLSLVPIGDSLKPEQMGLPEELPHRAFDLGVWLYYWPFGGGPRGIGTPPRSAFLNIQGRYQEEEMDTKLLAFGPETGGPESGYDKLDYRGVTYYALYEDYTQSLLYPRRAGIFNRIALVGDWLLAAPATGPLEALIDMHQGKGTTLLGSRPHRELAQVAEEGLLGGVFRDASVIEDSESQFIRRSQPVYEGYLDGIEITQALSPYDLTLSGYRMRETVEEIVIALYYPDPEAAQRDRAELEHRWNTLAVNFGSPSIELTPLTQLCAPLTTQVVEGRDYSVLIGICPMKRGQLPDAILDLPFLWRDVPHWLLYPDLEDLKSTQPTPTPTPTPIPTVRPDYSEKPPLGPGAEVGTVYPYSLYLHCGVRDAYFDGRRWMALDVPEEWQLNAPAGWTRDDANGQMTLVEGDLAVFTSNTGRTIKFVPWPSDVPWGPCV